MKRPAKAKNKAQEAAPSHLQPETQRWYERVLADFVLEEHHRRLLVLACEAWDRCQQARKALAEHGLIFEDRRGAVKARPEVAIERDSRIGFARLLRELNLDVEAPDESRPPALRGNANLRVVPS